MKRLAASLFLIALIAAPVAHAHSGPLDPAFGDGGMRHYGFQPIGDDARDSARVGCPGPNGTFVVYGSASGGRRIVTTRLRPDGELDVDFSGDGKESFEFDVSSTYLEHAPAVCLPNSDAVIVHAIADAAGEQNLRLVRVGRDTGLPVAGFGISGVADLDLDQYIAGLGQREKPLGVNVLANGDLVVTGHVNTQSQPYAAFVALLDATGQVRAVKQVDCWDASAAMDDTQGTLWAFGTIGFNACRLTLDRDTLAQNGRLIGPQTTEQFPGAARLVREGVVAMPTTLKAPAGESGIRAAMQVFRGNAVTVIPLPMPAQTSLVGTNYSVPVVQALPGGRALYGVTAKDLASGVPNGLYFALLRIGRNAADDALEPAFGGGGVRLARFQPDTPGCQPVAPWQSLHRLTQWLGRPAFVGKADATCLGAGAGDDYLVGRIETNYLFADGFD